VKRFWIILGTLAVMSIGFLMAVGHFINSFETAAVGDGGVLYWTVGGGYQETRDDRPLTRIFQSVSPLQREMVMALEAAASDEDIEGLFLEIHALPSSWAQIQELSSAVRGFSAAGKPVHAWMAGGGNREYGIALAADAITLAPEGILAVPGLRVEMTFVAGTLEKIGMKADYVHVGRYKSAPETYERTEPSAESREMIGAILDDQYDDWLDTMILSRGWDRDHAIGVIDRGLFDAEASISNRLIDHVDYLQETLDSVFPFAETVDLEGYALKRASEHKGVPVAFIPIVGTIVDGESSSGGWGGKTAGSLTVIDLLQACYDDDEIEAVVLRIDSPGGSALASDLIWNEVIALGQIKPVVVSMSGTAASGGYYVACAAESIFAQPGTLTGSIGVFAGKFARDDLYRKIGVTRTIETRGRNADLFGDQGVFSSEQREIIQVQLDSFYGRFVTKVADGRGMTFGAIDSISQGRVWTGTQARNNGLVDGLGGLPRALASIRSLLDLPPDQRIRLVSFERQPGWIERMLARTLEQPSTTSVLPLAALIPGADLPLPWLTLLDGRPLTLCPVEIDFH